MTAHLSRLCIFMLALLSGLSAAEAARPASAATASLNAVTIQTRIDEIVEVAIADRQYAQSATAIADSKAQAGARIAPVAVVVDFRLATPIRRHDITRE
jgi:hypothetical protein